MKLFYHTNIIAPNASIAVSNAVSILNRDMHNLLQNSERSEGKIVLEVDNSYAAETFTLSVDETATLKAGDDLGFIYGLLYISENFLGVQPFWFWMDQPFAQQPYVKIPVGTYYSPKPIVKYRGWFFNDEVFFMKWNINGDAEEPWRMAFETLLRCGGNMTIPGTDKNAHKNRKMAMDMGLWITHHHAEPLGAEMFAHAYPDIAPNILESVHLFEKLWEDAVLEQKDANVIWNVGFRGQGDVPFWNSDSSGTFDTPQKRGELISAMIRRQCEIVRKYVADPQFCTNLYGEISELYVAGFLSLPDDIICIFADNGFGKMVSRRQENHNPRIPSLPDNTLMRTGIYYHASFYDLQAAAHITMLPNSVDFVNRELNAVIENRGTEYWLINSSNVRPHVYYLDAIRKKWFGEEVSDHSHSAAFAREYFQASSDVATCLQMRPNVIPMYGKEEDEHVGDQFYNEPVRILVHQYIVDKTKAAEPLFWLTGDMSIDSQVKEYAALCTNALPEMQLYYERCKAVQASLMGQNKDLFTSTILLEAELHYFGLQGVIRFADAWKVMRNRAYLDAFILFGRSADCYSMAENAMRSSEYGVWRGFYFNECFADYKHTAFMVKKLMGIVRELGDSVSHDRWHREATYDIKDRKVMTLMLNENHMTDWELYQAFSRIKY